MSQFVFSTCKGMKLGSVRKNLEKLIQTFGSADFVSEEEKRTAEAQMAFVKDVLKESDELDIEMKLSVQGKEIEIEDLINLEGCEKKLVYTHCNVLHVLRPECSAGFYDMNQKLIYMLANGSDVFLSLVNGFHVDVKKEMIS